MTDTTTRRFAGECRCGATVTTRATLATLHRTVWVRCGECGQITTAPEELDPGAAPAEGHS